MKEILNTGQQIQNSALGTQAAMSLKQDGKNIAELILFDDKLFDRIQKWGEIMASSKSMIPRHLQGNPSDCSAVIMQALRWGVDPYACAQKTHIINGTLGYEAQLVNAILLANAPIEGRPKYSKIGDWSKILGKFKVVTGKNGGEYHKPGWDVKDEKGLGVSLEIKLKGEEVQPFELLLSQATVRNSTLWASDPFQQLCYLAIKRWSRLHCPDVIMGVYTPDEIQSGEHIGVDRAKNITPPASKANAFAASSDLVAAEVSHVNKAVASNIKEKPEIVYIKTPPGKGPVRGELPCNSLKEATDKMLKAIEARYQKGELEEIQWLILNNAHIWQEIETQHPKQYKAIKGLLK